MMYAKNIRERDTENILSEIDNRKKELFDLNAL